MGAEETLRIALSDDASAPAGVAVAALDRLDAALDKLNGKEIDVDTGKLSAAAVALNRLRTQAGAAGSAIAAMNAGLDPGKIGAATAATIKLSSVFDLMKNRAAAAAREEDRAYQAAVKAAQRVPSELQSGLAPKTDFQKLLGMVNSVFGQKAAGGIAQAGALLNDASAKLGPLGPVLAGGGKLIAVGALALAAAAAALVVAAGVIAVKLLAAGAQLAIAQTSLREGFVGPLEKVLGSAAAASDVYDSAIEVSVKLGLNKEDTLKRAKELAGVGFRGAEISVIIGAVADVKAGLGDEKANAFQKIFEKLKSGKLFNQEVINQLAEAGINSDAVIARLAKDLGISVNKVKEKLKAGTIDVGKGINALVAAAKDQTGSAAIGAANTVPALLTSLKTQFESLFDDVDLSSVKGAISSLLNVLSGPEGLKFKAAVNTLFGTLFKVLGAAFQGPEGEARIARFVSSAAKVMEGAAIILEKAGPSIIKIIDGLSKIFDSAGSTSGGSWLESIASGAMALSGALIGVDFAGFQANVDVFKTYLYSMGGDMIAGLVNGITSGATRVVSALVGAVSAAIAAAKAKLDSHSPSRVTHEMGEDTSEGYEGGIIARIGKVKASGATMALAALSGASTANDNASAAGGAAATRGGRAAGGNVTIVVQVQAGPGTTREQAQAAGDAAGEGAYRAWRRNHERYLDDEERAA